MENSETTNISLSEEDDLFSDGINGETWSNAEEAAADSYVEEPDEFYPIHKTDGIEIQCWPTYGNYTIVTNIFHMYLWFNGKIDVYDLRKPNKEFASMHEHVLTFKDKDLFFFGDKVGEEIHYYDAETLNHKVQRYLNLKAFL